MVCLCNMQTHTKKLINYNNIIKFFDLFIVAYALGQRQFNQEVINK